MNAAPLQPLPDGPLISWYGDDFTGAAAVMEVMTFAGLPAVLFFDCPTADQLARFAGYRGIGIAGIARSKSPAWMAENLPPIYRALARIGAPVAHYKFCSTLDSAPHIGSIGRAAELALPILGGEWHPLLIAAPEIQRYQAFGNLFASVDGTAYRLDRHPTMSRHPVTPMTEADVRRHLAAQTDLPIGLVDLAALTTGRGDAALQSELALGDRIVALDVVDEETLAETGRLIWTHRGDRLFAIGSQGIQYALVAYWRRCGLIEAAAPPAESASVDRMAAVSGSCSPITASQIEQARQSGFEPIRLDPAHAVDPTSWEGELNRAAEAALAALDRGGDPIVFTALGPEDPSTARYKTAIEASDMSADKANETVGSGLGRLLGRIVRAGRLSRAVIAGGDTSSHGVLTLGIDALTAKSLTAPGAALCQAHSEDPALDGFEIALKGGQMGPPDYFKQVKSGRSAAH